MDPVGLDEAKGSDPTRDRFHLATRLGFIEPPELPAPEKASIQDRAIALGIDALVWLVMVVPLGFIFGGFNPSNGFLRIKITGPPSLLASVLWLVYMTLMEARYGASLGKRTRGLRVLTEDGGAVDLEAALIRNLLRFVDAFPYVVPYLVGAVAASDSPRVQRFGDRVAETIVVREPEDAATEPGGWRAR